MQRFVFAGKLVLNATKTFKIIQKVYGESAVHRITVFCWYNAFSEERESICDEQRSGRATTTRMHKNIACVADISMEDRRSSFRLTGERVGIPKTNVQQILSNDFQKRKL